MQTIKIWRCTSAPQSDRLYRLGARAGDLLYSEFSRTLYKLRQHHEQTVLDGAIDELDFWRVHTHTEREISIAVQYHFGGPVNVEFIYPDKPVKKERATLVHYEEDEW